MMHLPKTIPPLLWRGVVFLSIFVAISGIIGPKVISGGILFRDGFALYGGIGKALIFGCIVFCLLVRHAHVRIAVHPWRPKLLILLLSAALLFITAWVGVDGLIAGDRSNQNLFFAHGGLLLGLSLTAVGCIGPDNLRIVWRGYRRVIVHSVAIAMAFYVFLLVVYALWRPLASLVLHSVKILLDFTGIHAVVIPPYTLLLDKFGVTIAQYCSGIESIALFTGLYVIVGLLDWKHLVRRRYFVIFPFALLGLSALNILRVFGLIMAGYYINPHIAFSLFHTYAGMVFFALYSIAFWAIAYKYLVVRPKGKP